MARSLWRLFLLLVTLSACGSSSLPKGAQDELAPVPLRPTALKPGEPFFSEDLDRHGQRRIRHVTTPCLLPYLPEKGSGARAAVLIVPGGGYQVETLELEGTRVASYLASRGLAAFVLVYRLPEQGIFDPLEDAQRAMRLLRARAAEYRLEPSRIGVLAFSAGAHLASMLGTGMETAARGLPDDVDLLSARPDFLALLYPVIALGGPFGHETCRVHLLGAASTEVLALAKSPHLHAGEGTPPTFLYHARDDDQVPSSHSLAFAEALQRVSVPVELHLIPTGGHGFGLPPQDHPAAGWPELLLTWLEARGFLSQKSTLPEMP